MNKSIQIEIRWVAVADEDGTPFRYPNRTSRYIKEKYCKPAVYRWRILPAGADGKNTIYIGEAEDLPQRIQRVRTPAKNGKGGETNKRLKAIFDEALASGKQVGLEIAEFEPFTFNGVQISPNDLHNQYKRCALENLLLSVEQKPDQILLNKFIDTVEKKIGRIMPNFSLTQVRQFVQRVQSQFSNAPDSHEE